MKDQNSNKSLGMVDQSELLVERFEDGIKNGFGAVFILHSIDKHQKASSQEMKEELDRTFKGALNYNYTAFYRLVARLRDEFALIQETQRVPAKGADRIYYCLTPLGKTVLNKIIERHITPLASLLKQ